MFNIGLSEIVILVILSVILMNPKDLPKLMRKVGHMMGTFRKYKDALNRELDSLNKLSTLEESKKKQDNADIDKDKNL